MNSIAFSRLHRPLQFPSTSPRLDCRGILLAHRNEEPEPEPEPEPVPVPDAGAGAECERPPDRDRPTRR